MKIDHGWLFHRDNDLKHTTRAMLAAPFNFFPKPVFRPKLNGKVFGGELKLHVAQQKPRNLKDLEKNYMEEWAKIRCVQT